MERMKLSHSANAERIMEKPPDKDDSARLGLLGIPGACTSGLGVPEQHSKPWDALSILQHLQHLPPHCQAKTRVTRCRASYLSSPLRVAFR